MIAKYISEEHTRVESNGWRNTLDILIQQGHIGRDDVIEPYTDPEITISQKIAALEQKQTPRLLREAALGDQYAMDELAKIDDAIKALRSEL